MKLFSKGSFALLAVAAALPAPAQLVSASVSGSADQNGSPFSSGNLSGGESVTLLAGNGSAASSSLLLGPFLNGDDESRRSLNRFTASGMGAFLLPSDRSGGTVAANSGDSVVRSTWNPLAFPQATTHSFQAEVSVADDADSASILLEVAAAPKPLYAKTGGDSFSTLLDGSIYDQDPAAGQVRLDKNLTPTLTIDFSLPEFTFTRTDVTWSDGLETASPFRDQVFSGLWFSFDQAGPDGKIFTSPDQSEVEFAPGESTTSKIVAAASGSFTIDLTQVTNGNFSVRHSYIPWHREGYDNVLGGGASGFFTDDLFENNVQVVPEPMPCAALGLGLLALLRRRRK